MANKITATRIVCSLILMFTAPFSLAFWIMYIYCGVSDMADGLVARIMRQKSSFGAKLDSIADIIFIFSAMITVLPVVVLPTWFLICMVIVAFIRITGYLIGYKKYRKFSALHTYANKATGGLLFCMPILIGMLGISITGIIFSAAAILSSSEELLITILSKDLNYNRKSLFL